MILSRKKVIVSIVLLCSLIFTGIIALGTSVNFLLPEDLKIKKKDICQIKITYGDNTVSIEDPQVVKEVLNILDKVILKSLLPKNVLPTGWNYNLNLINKEGVCQYTFQMVGDTINYKGEWYQIDDQFILAIRDYYNKYK